jgi:hypothetical protein
MMRWLSKPAAARGGLMMSVGAAVLAGAGAVTGALSSE